MFLQLTVNNQLTQYWPDWVATCFHRYILALTRKKLILDSTIWHHSVCQRSCRYTNGASIQSKHHTVWSDQYQIGSNEKDILLNITREVSMPIEYTKVWINSRTQLYWGSQCNLIYIYIINRLQYSERKKERESVCVCVCVCVREEDTLQLVSPCSSSLMVPWESCGWEIRTAYDNQIALLLLSV